MLKMRKEEVIETTNKVYKLTLLFPKKEPLRYKIREAADELLNNITSWEVIYRSNPVKFLTVDKHKKEEIIFEAEKNLETLKSYFEITKWQNWVSYFDVLKIEEEYDGIKCDFKKEIESLSKEGNNPETEDFSVSQKSDNRPDFAFPAAGAESQEINPRKRKILDFLKEKGRAQVWQVKEIFPQVSKRTLRRDFEQLLKKNIIKRIGERNNTFYQLNLVAGSDNKEKAEKESAPNFNSNEI